MLAELKNVLWGGITYDKMVSGGPVCVASSSLTQRICEIIFSCGYALFLLNKVWRRIYLDIISASPKSADKSTSDNSKGNLFEPATVGKILLMTLSLVFGMEIGFKIATGTLMWIVFPCHVVTTMILMSLVLPQSSAVASTLFKISLYWLNGATAALICPDTGARALDGEMFAFFAQHVLLLLVPFCLMATSYFRPDPLLDFTWPMGVAGVMTLYHFGILAPLAIATDTNFGYTLCPTPGDPMPPSFYRICHLFTQQALAIITGKVLILLSQTRLYKVE